MQNITLYTHPFSRGRYVVWMLKECGAEYTVVPVQFGTQMKSAEYLSINPQGQVPALKFGDAVLTESTAVNRGTGRAPPIAAVPPGLTSPRIGPRRSAPGLDPASPWCGDFVAGRGPGALRRRQPGSGWSESPGSRGWSESRSRAAAPLK